MGCCNADNGFQMRKKNNRKWLDEENRRFPLAKKKAILRKQTAKSDYVLSLIGVVRSSYLT